MINFNDAGQQQDYSDLIPKGTVARMILSIRAGGHGDGGVLTKSKSSEAEYLDCEFTITFGKFNKRKCWQNIMVGGVSDTALNISRSTIRAILESTNGVNPQDTSEKACQARCIKAYEDLNGLEFVGKIGIEYAKANSGYDDKNKLAMVMTPGMPEYEKVMDGEEINGEPEPVKAPSQAGPPAWAGSQPVPPSAPPVDSVPAWAR